MLAWVLNLGFGGGGIPTASTIPTTITAPAGYYAIWQEDTRKVSSEVLTGYLQPDFTRAIRTQYAAPSASPFTVTLINTEVDLHLSLTPTTPLAQGTITLPPRPVDKQTVLVNTTMSVTTLIVDGGTTVGAPSGLNSNDFFLLKYDEVLMTWYRIG